MALSGALALSGAGVVAGPALAAAHKRHVMQGITVKQVQRALHITVDGVWGPQTDRAVKRFQRRHGLEVDGVVGPQTARALGLHAKKAQSSGSRSVKAELRKIAQCESGGDPTAVSSSGTYRGKYQFDRSTWRALGGHGDPAKASEGEQDKRAAKLLRERGPSAWPNCA
ncbi:MAG TPA: transglycosylase family protein [Solirubrobacteraceae bacterium]